MEPLPASSMASTKTSEQSGVRIADMEVKLNLRLNPLLVAWFGTSMWWWWKRLKKKKKKKRNEIPWGLKFRVLEKTKKSVMKIMEALVCVCIYIYICIYMYID